MTKIYTIMNKMNDEILNEIIDETQELTHALRCIHHDITTIRNKFNELHEDIGEWYKLHHNLTEKLKLYIKT